MNDDLTPAMRALNDLMISGEWRGLPGPPTAAIFIRPWEDGSVDTLAMQGETDALVERTDAAGVPVWRTTGAVPDVIAALDRVPPPYALDAPREPLRDTPNADRDMGTP
jgi:hypothetical protein